jgi:hypothetical protein
MDQVEQEVCDETLGLDQIQYCHRKGQPEATPEQHRPHNWQQHQQHRQKVAPKREKRPQQNALGTTVQRRAQHQLTFLRLDRAFRARQR